MKRLIAFSLFTAMFFLTSPLTGFSADTSEAGLLAKTKISLTEAIASAVEHVQGRAIEASLDDDSFKPAYEVSVLKEDGRLFDVQIDGVSGAVLAVREDLDD